MFNKMIFLILSLLSICFSQIDSSYVKSYYERGQFKYSTSYKVEYDDSQRLVRSVIDGNEKIWKRGDGIDSLFKVVYDSIFDYRRTIFMKLIKYEYGIVSEVFGYSILQNQKYTITKTDTGYIRVSNANNTTDYFNLNGQLIKTVNSDSNSYQTSKIIKIYQNGLLMSEEIVNNNTPVSKSEFKYRCGLLDSTVYYDHTNNLIKKTNNYDYVFGGDCRLLEFLNNNSKKVYYYDEDGYLVRVESWGYNSDVDRWAMFSHIEYDYDKKITNKIDNRKIKYNLNDGRKNVKFDLLGRLLKREVPSIGSIIDNNFLKIHLQ